MNVVFCLILLVYNFFNSFCKTFITFNLKRKHLTRRVKFTHDKSEETSIIHGNSTSLNYYYLAAFFGSPPQKQSLIIDTGSSLTGIPCEKLCKKCGKHLNRYFDPVKSISNIGISCNDEMCTKSVSNAFCNENLNCMYSMVILFYFI